MKKIVAHISSFVCYIVLALALVAPAPAQADVLGPGVWTPVSAVNEDGNPFFDGDSWDSGSPAGVQTLLESLGLADLEYHHDGANNAVTWSMNNTPGATIDMLFQITAYNGGNTFGWYDTTNPLNYGTIFTGPQSPGVSTTLTLPTTFAFWYNPNGTTPQYLTDGSGYDQFALFRSAGNGSYYIGVEDLLRGVGDNDYNDMVVGATPVPEPASLLLVGSGIVAGVARYRRKNRRTQDEELPKAA